MTTTLTGRARTNAADNRARLRTVVCALLLAAGGVGGCMKMQTQQSALQRHDLYVLPDDATGGDVPGGAVVQAQER